MLADPLRAGLGADPSAPAVITRDRTLTWAELEEQSTNLARNYVALGLRRATASPR